MELFSQVNHLTFKQNNKNNESFITIIIIIIIILTFNIKVK